MYKRIIALFSSFVILFSCISLSYADDYSSDNQGANFWDWAMIYGNKYGSGTSLSGVVQSVTGWLSGKVCSLSPDSYHHSDVKPNAFGNGGRDDSGSYVWCTYKYCGDQFKLYTSIDTDHGGGFSKSDLQQSYEAQVAELPAPGYSADGQLRWRLNVKSFRKNYGTLSSFQCGTVYSVVFKSAISSGQQRDSIMCYFDCFIAPVSGCYTLHAYFVSPNSGGLYPEKNNCYVSNTYDRNTS